MKYTLELLEGIVDPVSQQALETSRLPDGGTLPRSYVDFARQYGFGVTCGEFLIYMPGRDHDSLAERSAAIRDTYADVLGSPGDVWFDLAPDVDFEQLGRLIPFAGSENGRYLFWDPLRAQPEEMEIYITDFRGLGFVRAAGDLYELIEKMTCPQRFREVFPCFRQEPLPATFRPLRRQPE